MARKAARQRLTPEQKKARRKIRAALRAEASKSGVGPVANDVVGRPTSGPERTPHREEQFWMKTRDRIAAMKVINDHRERPYWMSMPHRGGTPPISHFFPCSMFNRNGRVHYGFLFRVHRDRFYLLMKSRGARKELTE